MSFIIHVCLKIKIWITFIVNHFYKLKAIIIYIYFFCALIQRKINCTLINIFPAKQIGHDILYIAHYKIKIMSQ